MKQSRKLWTLQGYNGFHRLENNWGSLSETIQSTGSIRQRDEGASSYNFSSSNVSGDVGRPLAFSPTFIRILALLYSCTTIAYPFRPPLKNSASVRAIWLPLTSPKHHLTPIVAAAEVVGNVACTFCTSIDSCTRVKVQEETWECIMAKVGSSMRRMKSSVVVVVVVGAMCLSPVSVKSVASIGSSWEFG